MNDLRAICVDTAYPDEPLKDGIVWVDKLRPTLRGGDPVAFVEKLSDHSIVLNLDQRYFLEGQT